MPRIVARALWAYLTMWGVLILLWIVAPRLALAGAKGLISGDWRSWNRRLLNMTET